MSRKPPQRDPIGSYQRGVNAERRIGVGAQCKCGESRPEALIREGDLVICAECQRKRAGKTEIDDHHPGAAANDPTTVPIPVNDHRAELNVAQYDWPKETLENPSGSPVLAAAARDRGYVDTQQYLNEKMLGKNAEFLEVLHPFLVDRLGPEWWVGTPLEKFAPERRK